MVMCNECHARKRRGAERSVPLRNVHKSVDVRNTWRTQQKNSCTTGNNNESGTCGTHQTAFLSLVLPTTRNLQLPLPGTNVVRCDRSLTPLLQLHGNTPHVLHFHSLLQPSVDRLASARARTAHATRPHFTPVSEISWVKASNKTCASAMLQAFHKQSVVRTDPLQN